MSRIAKMKTDQERYERPKSLQRYYALCNSYPNLTDAEITDLLIRAQAGDEKAHKRVVLSHAKYVFTVLHFYYNLDNQLQELEDLVQEGMVGLLLAVHNYDVHRNVKFCTYSSFWIKKMISERIMKNTSKTVYRPGKRILRTAAILRESSKYEIKFGKTPSYEELAEITGETVKFIEGVMKDIATVSISFDEKASTFMFTPKPGSEGRSITYGEIIPSDENIEESVVKKIYDEEVKDELFEYFDNPKDQKILTLLMDNEKISHQKISEQIGCSRQNVTKRIDKIRLKFPEFQKRI